MNRAGFVLAALLIMAIQSLGDSGDNKKETTSASKATSGWPIFRGNPLQTGTARAPLPDTLAIKWKFKAKDAVEGAAVIAHSVVYVGAMDGSLYALDLGTGQSRWIYKAGPIKGGPSFHDGKVFVGDADGIFHCVDARTGNKLWTYDATGEVTSGGNFSDNTVLFGAYDEHLRCLSFDGKELWKFNVPGGPVLASPVVASGRTYVSGCDSTLHVIDTKTGKELGSVQLEGQTGASAAVVGDDLYVGTMSNQMLCIDLKKQAVKWKYESADNAQPFYASPAVSGDRIVVGCRDKRVHAFFRQTGKPAWEYATEGKVDSSPVIAEDRVYVGSNDGNLYVLGLAGGKLLQKINLGGPITASPAVASSYLVIGTQNGIVYGLGKEE